MKANPNKVWGVEGSREGLAEARREDIKDLWEAAGNIFIVWKKIGKCATGASALVWLQKNQEIPGRTWSTFWILLNWNSMLRLRGCMIWTPTNGFLIRMRRMRMRRIRMRRMSMGRMRTGLRMRRSSSLIIRIGSQIWDEKENHYMVTLKNIFVKSESDVQPFNTIVYYATPK